MLVVFVMSIFSYLALADSKIIETSGVTIKSFKCTKIKDTIKGSVETGNDLGGASYRLKFDGDAHIIQGMCDVLDTLKKKSLYSSLRISNLAEVPSASAYTGQLHAIVVPFSGD